LSRGIDIDVTTATPLVRQLGFKGPPPPFPSLPKYSISKCSKASTVIKALLPLKPTQENSTMGLFNKHETDETAPPPDQTTTTEPRRSSTLFRKHRDPSPTATVSSHATSVSSASPRRGLLHRNDEDPSIRAARERVLNAEAAEREADKALLHARAMVNEAREHVKRLEMEAAEQCVCHVVWMSPRLTLVVGHALRGSSKSKPHLFRRGQDRLAVCAPIPLM
jgi:hypothetical protein